MAEPTALNFYATAEDILKVFRMVEASCPLQYAMCGLFDEPERPLFQGVASLPALGVAEAGKSQLEPTFLVMLEGCKVNVRTVPQRRGGTKYAVDQKANPGTVMVRPGGLYRGL